MCRVRFAIKGRAMLQGKLKLADVELLSNIATFTLNSLHKFKNRKSVTIPIILQKRHKMESVENAAEYGGGKIYINTSCLKTLNQFYRWIMHEFAHYVQLEIKKIPFKKLAIDCNTRTEYYNNTTEQSARRFEKMGSLAAHCVKHLNIIKRYDNNL